MVTESRAERRRLERELARGVEFTPLERANLRRYLLRHPDLFRKRRANPADVGALERESDAVQARTGI